MTQTVRLWWTGASRRWRLSRRQHRAAEGERRAERLLERAGYTVLARQVVAKLQYGLDGERLQVTVRADLLVRRTGQAFVAEVKTGQAAPRLRTAATRRQLLEYAHAFDVAGVLLVDPERGRIARVQLPARVRSPEIRRIHTLGWLLTGALAGAAAVVGWLSAR